MHSHIRLKSIGGVGLEVGAQILPYAKAEWLWPLRRAATRSSMALDLDRSDTVCSGTWLLTATVLLEFRYLAFTSNMNCWPSVAPPDMSLMSLNFFKFG